MSAILERGEVHGVGSSTKLTFYGITTGPADFQAGRLQDPFALDFELLDISTDAKKNNPLVVIPRAPMNLVADKLALGRFVPSFTVDASEAIGLHAIRFFYTPNDGDAERSDQCEFDVVEGMSAFVPPFYCSPSDLKDEGVCGRTDSYLLQRIGLASRVIERITGRFFEPRFLELNLDGRGRRFLLLDIPIIAMEALLFETSPFLPSSLTIDPDLFRVYSRHISQGLTQPDDRNNPKIELFHPSDGIAQIERHSFTRLSFPEGQQNIIAKGVFGFTDLGSRSCGQTPELIRHVCKLLVIRELEQMTNKAKREDDQNRFRITSQKTREQSITLESLAASKRFGFFTGDPNIDTILASYVRPMKLGAA